MADQQRHYGRRYSILVQADPAYPDGEWPVSRCMGYVDARYLDGSSAVSGADAFFQLFDAAAQHFASVPYGLPVSPDLAAMFIAARSSGTGPPTRLLQLLLGSEAPRPHGPETPTQYAGVALDYLYTRRLPLDLLGPTLLDTLQDPAERLVALRQISWLREAGRCHEALSAAAAAIGLDQALAPHSTPRAPSPSPVLEAGVRVISADYGDSGLATNARRSVEALDQLGVAHDHLTVKMGALASADPPPNTIRPTVLIHAQPPDAVELILRMDPNLSAQRLIGFYMWETETAPPEFRLGLHLVDEIWTGSRYSAAALAAEAGGPLHVVGHAVAVGPGDARFDARALADAKDAFLVYTHFDANSWITRKNPVAAVRAFLQAFPTEDGVRLLIKTRGGQRDLTAPVRSTWEELEELITDDSRIQLVEEDLPPEVLAALMQAADCYISLHRSEGFGYGLAEAMLAGIPLIASAYGGSLDFTEAAWLVSCRRRAIRPGEFVAHGAGQYWGEPDVAVAAAHLAAIRRAPAAAKARAEAAQKDLATRLSLDALAERYREALANP